MKLGLFLLGLICLVCEAAQPPIILISIDTLRADRLSAYGYRKLRTPNLDAYSQSGTLFAAVDAPIPLTLPSHTALFTSSYPLSNGIEENAQVLPQGTVTLAGLLRARGYRTAAFIGSVFLEKELGLDQGFDVYDSPFHFAAFSRLTGSMFFGARNRNPYSVRESRPGPLVVRAAERWLMTNRDQPVFAFLHLFDMHKPYRLPAGFERPAGLSDYDAELLYMDQVLGRFRETLKRLGVWDRALVVLLSDHGEGLGDHGESAHGYFIYESTLHVPLAIHWPSGQAPLPARVSTPASLIDVAPTLLDYLKLPVPGSFAGRSLLKGGSAPVVAETLHTHHSFGWAPLRSIRDGKFKYIGAPRAELYDLEADPGETRNLIGARPAEARRLRQQLAQVVAQHPPKPAPAAANVPEPNRTLRSLGYLAAGPKRRAAGLPADPKDRLPIFHLYEKAMMQLADGQLDRAAGTLRSLLVQDPDNTLARRDLGGVYLEQKSYEKARECLERVAREAPDDYPTRFQLGIVYERLERRAEAERELEAACRLSPGASQCREELEKARAKAR